MNLVLEVVESVHLEVRLLGYFIGMEGSQGSCLVRITLEYNITNEITSTVESVHNGHPRANGQ